MWCSELGDLMRDLGERLTHDDLRTYFTSIDVNKDDKVDFNEFVNAMRAFIAVSET